MGRALPEFSFELRYLCRRSTVGIDVSDLLATYLLATYLLATYLLATYLLATYLLATYLLALSLS
jgi:hypothetical protein